MYQLKYSNGVVNVPVDEKNVVAVLESNPIEKTRSPEACVKAALDHPIGGKKIKDAIQPTDKVCIIASDITRSWQSPFVFLPILVDYLNAAGIKDEQIVILFSLGTHRQQTEAEKKQIVGEDLYRRIKLVDHNCDDSEHLEFYGETSRGTPVYLNSLLSQCDKIILTGAAIYHLLAGFGGGGKSILPGVASRKTIYAHHNLGLNPEVGTGSNPASSSGRLADNPFHLDIVEAAAMTKPAYLLNVVVNKDHDIINAFAGDWRSAHDQAAEFVRKVDGVSIKKQVPLVIASAEGFPKDINLYQSSKTLTNGNAATKEGGTLIMLTSCREGFGNAETQHFLCDFETITETEEALRKAFSIGGYIGFDYKEIAGRKNLILVSEMDKTLLEGTGIYAVSSIEEALEVAKKLNGGTLDVDTLLMPQGGTTFPVVDADASTR